MTKKKKKGEKFAILPDRASRTRWRGVLLLEVGQELAVGLEALEALHIIQGRQQALLGVDQLQARLLNRHNANNTTTTTTATTMTTTTTTTTFSNAHLGRRNKLQYENAWYVGT